MVRFHRTHSKTTGYQWCGLALEPPALGMCSSGGDGSALAITDHVAAPAVALMLNNLSNRPWSRLSRRLDFLHQASSTDIGTFCAFSVMFSVPVPYESMTCSITRSRSQVASLLRLPDSHSIHTCRSAPGRAIPHSSRRIARFRCFHSFATRISHTLHLGRFHSAIAPRNPDTKRPGIQCISRRACAGSRTIDREERAPLLAPGKRYRQDNTCHVVDSGHMT